MSTDNWSLTSLNESTIKTERIFWVFKKKIPGDSISYISVTEYANQKSGTLYRGLRHEKDFTNEIGDDCLIVNKKLYWIFQFGLK